MSTVRDILDALDGFGPTTAGELVRLLAAAHADPEGLAAASANGELDWAQLEGLALDAGDDLARLVAPAPPSDVDDVASWLDGIEVLDLASRTLAQLDMQWASGLRARLSSLVAERMGALPRCDVSWLFARDACERIAGAGLDDLAPWYVVARASVRERLARPGVDWQVVLGSWALGHLTDEDSAALRTLVIGGPSSARDAYRARLAASLSPVTVSVGDPALEIHRTPLRVPLPHLGDGVALEIEPAAERGIAFRWPGRPAVFVPRGTTAHRLEGDDTTGPLDVGLREWRPSTGEVAWRAVLAARALPSLADRAADVALAVCSALGADAWRSLVRQARDAFDSGADVDDDAVLAVERALEARIRLGDAAGVSLAPALLAAIERVDELYAELGPALLVLDDATYADLVGDASLPFDAWWGYRASVEHAIPEVTLVAELVAATKPTLRDRVAEWLAAARAKFDRLFGAAAEVLGSAMPAPALTAMAADGSLADLVRSLPDRDQATRRACLDEVRRTLASLPCPWLDGGLVAAVDEVAGRLEETWVAPQLAADVRPSAGRAPVPAYIEALQVARVVELRVHRSLDGRVGDPLEHARLGPTARDAVRVAFRAAASRTRTGLPRWRWEEHVVEVTGLDGASIAMVDGASLGLSAALAFLSAWLETPLPADWVASARFGGANTDLCPVGFVADKALALARRGGDLRLLVHPEAASGGRVEGVRVRPVATLGEAIAELGLDRAILADSHAPEAGDTAARLRELDRLVRDAEAQRLEPYRFGGGDQGAWALLADRMRLLSASLGQDHLALAARGAATAALAYSYAGDTDSAAALVGGLDPAAVPLPVRLLVHVVRVVGFLNHADWPRCEHEVAALERAFEDPAVRVEERALYRGAALGTRGRVFLHQRRPEEAIPLLLAAVEHHERHPAVRHEVARSRTYLAQALREAGELQRALDESDRALRDLDVVRAFSTTYALTTETFIHYERARELLCLDRAEEAVRESLRCLELARDTGWRPLPGALRTLAWAARRAGADDLAERACDELDRVVGADPRSPADRAIRDEARGPFRLDGCIY